MSKTEWDPPTDPGDAYKQAIFAREKGNFEEALTKHIWFHDHALEIEPAYAGVRLSYNLTEWSTLAEEYPPAKMALIRKADEARQSIINGPDDERNTFHDYVSINNYLNASQNTVDLFVWLEENRPGKAKMVFNLAFSDLLEAEKYQLLSKHIEPIDWLEMTNKMYNMHSRKSSDPKMEKELREYSEQYFTYNVGALVAILVNSNQPQVAGEVVELSAGKVNSEQFNTVIINATKGIPPDKWP